MAEVEVGTASRTHLVNLVGRVGWAISWGLSSGQRPGPVTLTGTRRAGAGPVLPWAAWLLLLSAWLAGYRAVVAVADAAAAKAALAEGGESVPWEELRIELRL